MDIQPALRCHLCGRRIEANEALYEEDRAICQDCANDLSWRGPQEAESENEIDFDPDAYDAWIDQIHAEIEQNEIDEENRLE